jgi:dTDP-4-amino-4,6-dideoxy-D-galactose acyltransferase
MGLAGLPLIETRLTYFHDNVAAFYWPERFPVRIPTVADIPNLRHVAMQARNLYDRCHADSFFSEKLADDYLATFVENSVKGFADRVLVPAVDDNMPDAFFTANVMKTQMDIDIGRIVLVAIGAARQGWHLKLMAEMTDWFKTQKINVACMTTQSTNRAVIRNSEKLGFRYGRATHLFSTHL